MSKTLEEGKAEVAALCEYFATNRTAFSAPGIKEAHVRQSLIDPFFEALGWNVRNNPPVAPQYREVIPEDSLDVEGQQKSPDYTFRVGTLPKFYAEAKKCDVKIFTDPAPAYQLRRYGWSAKVAVSILTDFEELGVYDCSIRPRPSDKATYARILQYRFEEYPDRWRELWDMFSREAVWSGAFDRYAASKRKRGTSEVDAEFLKEIEGWRDELARNIALRNARLSGDELNRAVQLTIDRVVFLRMAEDRGLEPCEQLLSLCRQESIYDGFIKLCRKADDKYNSGLFHFQKEADVTEAPDTITPRLSIDDKVLRPIIQNLYFAYGSPYEFKVLPVEILGTVYERFLGKVIRLTAGHQAKIEEKPDVRKAGGVYYTPKYIVNYIVRQTVGRQIEGKSPRQLAGKGKVQPFRVLDMACGSGSFLLGAYQCLLDHCLTWYSDNRPEGFPKAVYAARVGGWQLTIAEKKRILTTHVFGVDIDPQAVEVSKLSLLLKVLEGENAETVGNTMRLFHQRALPNLSDNIKCGNSLIGPDYFIEKAGRLFDKNPDAQEYARVNAFDWKREFPAAMSAGGFDCVIGNPPYVRQESLSNIKGYLQSHYKSFDASADLYAYFMEKSLSLLKAGGLFSYIVSSGFLRATFGEPLRRHLKSVGTVRQLVDFGGLPVFASAKDTYVCIPLISKGVTDPLPRIQICRIPSLKITNLTPYVVERSFTIPPKRFSAAAWALTSNAETAVFDKIKKGGEPLGEYVERKMFYGLKTGLNDAFVITAVQRKAIIKNSPASALLIKPFLGGEDIRRYHIEDDGKLMIVIPCGWTRANMTKARKDGISEKQAWEWLNHDHSGIAKHLEPFESALRKRQDQGDFFWELRPCDYYSYLDGAKIVFPDICKGPRFHVDREGVYLANTAYFLGSDSLYLLGLLNSRLFWFAISNISIPFGIRAGEYRYRLIYQYMEQVPIRPIDAKNPSDKAAHDRMVKLVNSMLAMHKQFASAKSEAQRGAIQRQIEATDPEIDRLVYDLYGLTKKEIAIVEGRASLQGDSHD